VKNMSDEVRIGVYVCHCGGNISDTVDVEKVVEEISKIPGVVVARHFIFMCSDAGQKMIEEDIKKYNLNRVIVAACSPSLHELTFRNAVGRAGLNEYLYEHVNLREQCSWVHRDKEKATKKAINLIAMMIGKAKNLEPLERQKLAVERNVAIIGGGLAGLRAAVDLAKYGFNVCIIEKSPFLGGKLIQHHIVFPSERCGRDIIEDLINEIKNNSKVKIYTCAQVTNVSGFVGDFEVEIVINPRYVKEICKDRDYKKAIEECPVEVDDEFNYGLSKRKAIYIPYDGAFPPYPAIDMKACTKCGKCVEILGEDAIDLEEKPRIEKIKVGAIIVATGFEPYQPEKGEFGYGEFPNIITLPQLERLLDPQGPTKGNLVIDGVKPRNIAFIMCVGSRETPEQFPNKKKLNQYCSRYCCTATIHLATKLKEKIPESNIFIIFRDIRTYGLFEDYYYKASERGVMFFRYEKIPKIGMRNGKTYIKVKDVMTFHQEVIIPVDLIVLSVGMEPGSDLKKLSEVLRFPLGEDRFALEAHPKLKPVESLSPGIFFAGTVQGPKNILETLLSASAAAVKAAQTLARGEIELEPYIAVVDEEKCGGCGICSYVCPFEAIEIVTKEGEGRTRRVSQVTPALCQGCGVCASSCPSGAIDLRGYKTKQLSSMLIQLGEILKAVHPYEGD